MEEVTRDTVIREASDGLPLSALDEHGVCRKTGWPQAALYMLLDAVEQR